MKEDEIIDLISENEIEKVFEILLAQESGQKKAEISILSNRFEELNRKQRLGVVSNIDATIERNQICNAIIETMYYPKKKGTLQFFTNKNFFASNIFLAIILSLISIGYFVIAPNLIFFPLILGSVLFVIKQFLNQSKKNDPIVQSVIGKIKEKVPEVYEYYDDIDAENDISLFSKNLKIQETLSRKELDILDNALKRQFNTNIFIISMSGILLVIGLFFYTNQISKPQPLHIDNIQIQNTDSLSRNLLVDLDPVEVTWTISGIDEEVFVVLENVETGQQTPRLRVQASEGRIIFKSNKYDNYEGILSNRIPLQSNRIRAIIYGATESFKSKEFDIKVGVRMYVFFEQPNLITFWPTVDNQRVSNYHFLPSIALFDNASFRNPEILRGSEMAPLHSLVVPKPEKVNPEAYILTFENKQDDRIVRTEVDLSELYKLKN